MSDGKPGRMLTGEHENVVKRPVRRGWYDEIPDDIEAHERWECLDCGHQTQGGQGLGPTFQSAPCDPNFDPTADANEITPREGPLADTELERLSVDLSEQTGDKLAKIRAHASRLNEFAVPVEQIEAVLCRHYGGDRHE